MAWNRQEKNKYDYPTLFRESPLRGNIVRWYPIRKGQKVLLLSEKCTALESSLQEMGAVVTALALNQNLKEVGIETHGYDVVLHVGIIDAGEKAPMQAWQNQIEQYRTFLKSDGILLLAVQNRMGLKYFAGCQDDNYDVYFAGPEGYSREMTRQALSREEYEHVLDAVGFTKREFYYPYPDYLFPCTIYSDKRLPESGELTEGIRNFDKDRYLLFDEAKVFDSLRKEGLFSHFSNSFFIVCNAKQAEERVIYSKFSVERDARFQVRTDIIEGADDSRVVRKYPLTQAAKIHVCNMEKNFERLEKLVAGTSVRFCPAKTVEIDGNMAVEFSWVRGEALQNRLKRLLESGENEEAEKLIRTYIRILEEIPMNDVADVDLIFPNILVDGDIWNVIDYEWTFEKEIPVKWIIYRGLFFLSIELPGYALTEISHLLELAEITDAEMKEFAGWEAEFQAYLKGDTIPVSDMVDLLGNEVIPFEGNRKAEDREAVRRMNLEEKNARKLFFHLDQIEKRDGKALLCGWACARTKNKKYIPVHIMVFDEDGNPIGRAVERSERPDVASVLKSDTDFAYWGFNVSWSLQENKKYTLRLNAGKCQQEMLLEEFSSR